jgi:hypothetical protein
MTNDRIPQAIPAPLSARSAFVVHLISATTQANELVLGRVEHITSGRSTRFGSVTELIGFMQRALAQGE